MALMNLRPQAVLTDAEIKKGMKVMIRDGLASEMMTTFTGSAFLVAMALLMGANNVQIGLLASLPTFTKRLLAFNSAWAFSLNIATPFFTVFMMKTMGLPISYIIILSIISQLSSIFTIRTWGTLADRYSNKSIIALTAPIYIVCIIAWCFVGIYSHLYANLILLAGIHIFTGIATAGINLSLTNIGLKLAPREDAIVYLSVKNIITSFFSSIGPLAGGILADYFTKRSLLVTVQWSGPAYHKAGKLLSLHEWNFLFLIGALLALLSLELLVRVREVGEVEKDVVKRIMRTSIKSNLKESFLIGNIISWHEQLRALIKVKKNTSVRSRST